MLIQRIKKLIDVMDVKNDNDVHFQYIFNVKEEGLGGWGSDGDITDFLDKIFSSKEMEDNLAVFSDLIKYNLDENLKNENTGTLKSEDIEMFSFGMNLRGLINDIIRRYKKPSKKFRR